MSKLGVAVVGCGSMGSNHVRVYSELENTRLVGVYDELPEVSIDTGQRYRNCRVYPDLESLLADHNVDAVSVCVPTEAHHHVGKRVINAGKHCLIEKPVTKTLEEAEDLKEAAKEKGVQVQVGHIERFNPVVQQALKMVEDDQIGELYATHHRRLSPMPKRILDVGVVIDLMIHELDIATLFGRIVKIQGEFIRDMRSDIHALCILNYSSGAIGSIGCSWINPKKVRRLDLYGSEGSIEVEYISQDLRYQKGPDKSHVWFHKDEPLKNELESFAQNILDGEPVESDIDVGIYALYLCKEFLRSVRMGLPQKVS